MINVFNIISQKYESHSHPEFEVDRKSRRKTEQQTGSNWVMMRNVSAGIKRLVVYKSISRQRILWFDPSEKLWAHDKYDSSKDDGFLYKEVLDVMSQSIVQMINTSASDVVKNTAVLDPHTSSKDKQSTDPHTSSEDKQSTDSEPTPWSKTQTDELNRMKIELDKLREKSCMLEEQNRCLLDGKRKAEDDALLTKQQHEDYKQNTKKKMAVPDCDKLYNALIKEVMKQYADAKDSESKKHIAKYLFIDEHGRWSDVQNYIAEELDKLSDSTLNFDKVHYTLKEHSYEARLYNSDDASWKKWAEDNSTVIYAMQINLNTSTERRIIRNPNTKANGVLSENAKHELLFGKSFVQLSRLWIDHALESFSFTGESCHHTSKELAALAELFTSLTNLNFTYLTGDKFLSELYVKPTAIKSWLEIARDRKYTHLRIVLHGSDTSCYNSVRADPQGMCMKNAGMHGLAHGSGIYFGLSHHVTISYNKEKAGTALIGLLLTDEDISTRCGSYETFELSAPKRGVMNCIVVRESFIQLILGKIVSV